MEVFLYYPLCYESSNVTVDIAFNFEYLFATKWLVASLYFAYWDEFPCLIIF